MATVIIQSENAQQGLVLSASTSPALPVNDPNRDTVGKLLRKQVTDSGLSGNSVADISISTESFTQGPDFNLTSMGRYGESGPIFEGSLWRVRNRTGGGVNGRLRGFSSTFEKVNLSFGDDLDTFIISPLDSDSASDPLTHILEGDGQPDVTKAAADVDNAGPISGDADLSAPAISNTDNYIITGSGFDDELTGANEDDTLTGGVGDDTLTGGLGSDELRGGVLGDPTGNDIFAYNLAGVADAGTEFDTIEDFVKGQDQIGLAPDLTLGINVFIQNNVALNFSTISTDLFGTSVFALVEGVSNLDATDFTTI